VDKGNVDVHSARTLELRENLLKCCADRGDTWALEVRGRLESCNDLVAEEAVYHRACYIRFKQGRDILVDSMLRGRPADTALSSSFECMCDFLENSCDREIYMLDELRQKMIDDCGEAYSKKHLKRKLQQKYGNHIFFAEINGRPDVICFKDLCSYFLSDMWYQNRKTNIADEIERIVRTAGKLIASAIRDMPVGVDYYPSAVDITSSASDCSGKWVPTLLQMFMSERISSKVKQTAICQTIVQALRPRTSIMPIPLALTASIDNVCGSSELIIEIARMGFCLSYDELLRFKQSVIVSKCAKVESSSSCGISTDDDTPERLTQFIADNVDHDIRTLDGSGTFHGMGIINATVQSTALSSTEAVKPLVPRLQHRLPAAQVSQQNGVPIVPYHKPTKAGVAEVVFVPLLSLQQPLVLPSVMNVTVLWHLSAALESNEKPTPNWWGFMQELVDGSHAGAAQIDMKPLVDLHPTDDTCIYSTLLFVDQQARHLKVPVTCITFDQPLWLKAVDICMAAGLNRVCRLGGFHLLMSYLGCIGHVMAGSGLEEMFLLNYGSNTVCHMMSGKAFARSLRGHLLVARALTVVLLQELLSGDEGLNEADCTDLSHILAAVQKDKVCADDCTVLDDTSIIKTESLLVTLKNKLSSESRTAKLWMQYLYHVDLVQRFILAERTGNWLLHLSTVSSMLTLFAAAGHHNYAKSARLYLQLMNKLLCTRPWLYDQFISHGHTVRRTNRFWAGLSTDLIIEQTMMKSLKSHSGLTHGRGLSEPVRNVWVHSMHEMASMHLAVKSFTQMTSSSDIHTDCGTSRVHHDYKDMLKVVEWLRQHNPFVSSDSKLHALHSGITAGDVDCVNCDSADTVGMDIQQQLDGIAFTDASIKRKHTVKTLAHLNCDRQLTDSKLVSLDSCGLFFRLLVLVERCPDVESYFACELTNTPLSLFGGTMMHKAVKPALAKAIACGSVETLTSHLQLHSSVVVVDGGAMLHKVKWLKHVQFSDVLLQYVTHIHSRYGHSAIIVFDGYQCGATTKDHEHRRRGQKSVRISPDVFLTTTTPVPDDQHAFLANSANKVKFIAMLSSSLEGEGFAVIHAEADADTDIVHTALEKSRTCSVAVAADDTDILVLLAYHLSDDMNDICLISQSRNQKTGKFKETSIRQVQQSIGKQACKQLLVVHAIGGCDTTSAIFGIGKGTVFHRLCRGTQYVRLTGVLQDRNSKLEDIIAAGLQLLVAVYGGKQDETLTLLRYRMYCRMVTNCLSRLKPQRLPPTEHAAKFHVMRSHLQAVRWSTLSSCELDPCDWGWRMSEDGELIPIMTDRAVAPDDILNIIRCKCKSSCTSSLCSCKKNGLHCVTACANCHGNSCLNVDKSTAHEIADADSYSDRECDDTTADDRCSKYWYFGDDDWDLEEIVN